MGGAETGNSSLTLQFGIGGMAFSLTSNIFNGNAGTDTATIDFTGVSQTLGFGSNGLLTAEIYGNSGLNLAVDRV